MPPLAPGVRLVYSTGERLAEIAPAAITYCHTYRLTLLPYPTAIPYCHTYRLTLLPYPTAAGELLAEIANPSTSEIVLSPRGSPFALESTLVISRDLTLRGGVEGASGADRKVVLDAQRRVRAVHITGTVKVCLEGLDIVHGLAQTGGSAGPPADSTSGASPEASYGGVWIEGNGSSVSHVQMRRVSIASCEAGYWAGGLGVTATGESVLNLTMEDVMIRGNTAGGASGGVQITNDGSGSISVAMVRVTAANNTAGANNGGIYLGLTSSGSISATMADVTVRGNTAGAYAGGLHIGNTGSGSTDVAMSEMTVEDNVATINGGGVRLASYGGAPAHVTIGRSAIRRNTAQTDIGGLQLLGPISVALDRVQIHGNRALRSHGGIFVGGGAPNMRAYGVTIEGNEAASGSGGLVVEGGTAQLSNGTFFRANLPNSVLPTGGTTFYQLPAPPGHWVPNGLCIVYRQPCPRNDAACQDYVSECSTTPDGLAGYGDGATPVTPQGHTQACPHATRLQPCEWDAVPNLLGDQIYTLPFLPIMTNFPSACAAGVLGSTNPQYQSALTCEGRAWQGVPTHWKRLPLGPTGCVLLTNV